LPEVTVRIKPGTIDVQTIQTILRGIQPAVAEILTCQGSELTIEDVSVIYEEGSSFDINVEAVRVTIITRNKPERMENGDGRAEEIKRWLVWRLKPGTTYKIRILFMPISSIKGRTRIY